MIRVLVAKEYEFPQAATCHRMMHRWPGFDFLIRNVIKHVMPDYLLLASRFTILLPGPLFGLFHTTVTPQRNSVMEIQEGRGNGRDNDLKLFYLHRNTILDR